MLCLDLTFLNIPISILLGILLGALVGFGVALGFEWLHRKGCTVRNTLKVVLLLGISLLLLAVEEQLDGMLEAEGSEEADAQKMLPEELESLIEKYDVSLDGIIDEASIKENVEQTSKEIADRILDAVLLPVLETICFILIYIICSSLLSVAISVIGTVFKLPVINGINKALGGVLGAVKGIAVIAVLSVVAVFAAGILPENELTLAVSQASLTNAISEAVIQFII